MTLGLVASETPSAVQSCAGQASLLQKQQQRSRHILDAAQNAKYDELPERLLAQMIMSNPWKCDLLPTWDPRRPTCQHTFVEAGLHPARLTALGNSSHDHMNSMRMLFPIGALPCCSTMPFCSAPACAETESAKPLVELQAGGVAGAELCTKHESHENFAFMTSPNVWPAYHGWSGSYELDVQKHLDVLRTALRHDQTWPDNRAEPFDLVIDIGYNSGYITEKMTTRHFATNYIVVEAYVGMLKMFQTRLGDETWKQRWFTEQIPEKTGAQVPQMEFLNYAVNSASGGTLDLCQKDDAMWSAMNNNAPCPVDKVALDDVIPKRLSPKFRSTFEGAQSAYVKVDVEGMDENALRGMSRILKEERGNYSSGAPRHLVNFMQLEYCVICQKGVKQREKLANYDLKTTVKFLEDMGFETFLMGPRYLPLSHGSWDDSFMQFTEDPENSFGSSKYPAFNDMICPGPQCVQRQNAIRDKTNLLASDLFAMRATHPMSTKIKLALGVCRESHDFNLDDAQYAKVDAKTT